MNSRDSRQTPLVSIVTPTLNRARFLEMTIRSVRNQTYPRIEHIVVDGGSTDRTTELLRRYEGTYGLTWTSAPDNGMYEAINRGLRQASGEIVTYLNSDDLYFPWAVETIVGAFARNPRADFVFGDAVNVEDVSGRVILYFQMPFNADHIRRCGFLCQPAVFWRRGVLQDEGDFDASLRYIADCEYWMRAADRQTFVKVNEFIAIERDHTGTIRQRLGQDLAAELSAVRGRYVRLAGWHHRARLIHHWLRTSYWRWVHRTLFVFQSVFRRRQPSSWPRFIGSGGLEIKWHLVPLCLLPNLGGRRPRLIRSTRDWLEPAE
jgi:glycosyltransferase involved in cell wall biosynthesis